MRLGLIGGTGIDLPLPSELLSIETPYRDVDVRVARHETIDVFFLPRHGPATNPAHRVEHRANVDALARCKVDRVIAINAVGSLDPKIPPGSLLVPHDLLDLRGASVTFHEDLAVHVDVTQPYCPEVRRALVSAAPDAIDRGVYAATAGPRLETGAEVEALRRLGASVVGMTGAPEAFLARERALCYASLCLVTNLAPDLAPAGVSAGEMRAAARTQNPRAIEVAPLAARRLGGPKSCACQRALDTARL